MITKDIDTGLSTISRYWTTDEANVLQLAYELQDAECGVLRENKIGQIAFESRAHRPAHTAAYTFGTGGLYMWNLRQEDPLRGIYNQVDAQRRTFNVSESALLAIIADVRNNQGGTPPTIPTGTTTISIRFPGPGSPSNYIAVASWGTVDVEVNTAIDGTGTDITNSNISLARTEYADKIDITLTSTYGSNAYAVILRAHGTAVVEGDPVPVSASDTTSIINYRKRTYPNPSRWLTDATEAQDYCDHVLAMYKDPHARVTFEVKANYSAAHLAAVAAIDVSDKIHIHATVATYGLGIDGDFFVEYIRHRVDSGRVHVVEYQCRAAATHNWSASGTVYNSKTIPEGVPDDLYVSSIDPALHCVFGAEAWKYNGNITGARFRAKYYASQQESPVDLRTLSEGGTLEHDPDSGMYVVENLIANSRGVQYELDSLAEGYWYFAFQFTSAPGDSVWTDGNRTPRLVNDYLPTGTESVIGPPSDWWVEVEPDPTTHRVRVHASRPKINGGKIWAWVAQIKDISSYGFDPVGTQVGGAGVPTEVFPCDVGVNNVSWAMSNGYRTLTRESGTGLVNPGDVNDQVNIGWLILVDVRGGLEDWDESYCRWGTVDTIQGLKSGYNINTATYFSCATPFREMALTGVRAKVVSGPWMWYLQGYFGNEPNRGLYEEVFWEEGRHGDTTTEIFISDWIDVPAAVDLANVGARVWFDNGYSRSDNGVTYGVLAGDTGNPSGAHDLSVLTHADDPSIPTGYIVLQWYRDTSNYQGIYAIAVILSSDLPAEGPYSAERAAHGDCIIESGTCSIVKGNKSVTVTRATDSDALGRVFAIYNTDGDLDANIIAEQGTNKIILTSAFNKTGAYNYVILKRWFDTAAPDTDNLAYIQLTPSQVANDIDQEVWRTQPIPVEWGEYEVTVYSRNRFGVGTRLTSGSTATIGGCVSLTVADAHLATDVNKGRIFTASSNTNYTLDNPTGTLVCGITVLWKLSGTGIPTLDTKFRLMDGETIDKSSGRDLLAAIYNAVDDEWDAFWKKGT